MDLFSNRLHFKFKNRLSRITTPSISKLLEGVVFSNGPGYSRIYLSYLGCKLDCFTCLLVMIKTNTTRKPTTYTRRSYALLLFMIIFLNSLANRLACFVQMFMDNGKVLHFGFSILAFGAIRHLVW